MDHDEAWVKHFSKFQLGACSEVQVFDLYTKRFRDKYETLSYKGFENVAKDGKFQLIAIDGPFGSKKFSRNDVLDHLESIIDTDNFIIVFDDTNRSGEYQTFKEIVSKLEDLGVEHDWCRYYGDKIISLVYSSNYKYLNSL